MIMEERVTRNPNAVPEAPEERNEKELAALSYLWVFGLIILVAKRANPFIQHHARRGTVLFMLSLLLWPIAWLRYGEYLVMALSLFGFIQAATGNENHTPIVSEVADGTFGKTDLRIYTEKAIRMVKPNYVSPKKETGKTVEGAPEASVAKSGMVEAEEQKLSALYHRLSDDENEMHRLESEVKKLEGEVETMKK
jgi:uncharacterized membrane protein